jgi:hypothetical protein
LIRRETQICYDRDVPLLDHFHPPLSVSHPWMGFHSTWATTMAQVLNRELLPGDYCAIPNVQLGGQDGIDVFEVQVLRDFGGPQLRAAVELVSPANKDRPGQRRAFAIKCASYLQRGVSVVVIDVVTERTADLHAQLMETLNLATANPWRPASNLYAVAYRTATPADGGQPQLEAWPEPLRLAEPLATLPLWIDTDLPLPLHLEESYLAACESLRIRV